VRLDPFKRLKGPHTPFKPSSPTGMNDGYKVLDFATLFVLKHLYSHARRGPRHAFFSSRRRKSTQSRFWILVFARIYTFIHPASPCYPRPSGTRSGTPDERNAREKARKIPARRVAPTCRREWTVVVLIVSSSAHHHLPRTHRLPRAVKAVADGRPATRRGELMPARLYNVAYRVWPATFASSHLPPVDQPTSSTHILELEQWRATLPTRTARRTTTSAADRCTSGRAGCCTRPATWRRRTSGRPKDGA
jgi:hypothetical protein